MASKQWYSVEDQRIKPPILSTLLVSGPDWEMALPAMWDGSKWNMWTGAGLVNTITHWRYLPGPYIRTNGEKNGKH